MKFRELKFSIFQILLLLYFSWSTQVLNAQEVNHLKNKIEIDFLKNNFQNPPAKYRMLQITHNTKMDGMLDSLQKYGYGGVVSNVGFDNYLQCEDEWDKFGEYLARCKNLGMNFWIYDEHGYPSGKAGRLTLEGHPEFETIGVLCARTEGKGTLLHHLPQGERYLPEPLYICAAPVEKGLYDFSKKVDLTPLWKKESKTIEWSAPDNKEWGVLSFHIKRMYEGTHIVTNISDSNPYINIIDKDAVARFISLTHEAYKQRIPLELKNYVHAFFTDEPSLMTSYLHDDKTLLPAIPWSRAFRKEFLDKYNYDIVPMLPYLFEDGGNETVYKRLDFWSLVSKLVEENYYGQIQNWCNANGPASSGHALLEESLYWHAVYEGNLYRNLRRMDLPALDMLTSDPVGLAHSNQIPVPKFVSSVAHLSGRSEIMSETSAHQENAIKQPVSFEMRLATVGYQFALGLTTVTSYYKYDEFSDAERTIFNSYIGRLSMMLSKGKHVADVAVYYPIQSMWGNLTPTKKNTWEPPEAKRTESVPEDILRNNHLYLTNHIIPYRADLPEAQRVDASLGEVSKTLLSNQLDFDFIDDQAIIESKIKKGTMQLIGEKFSILILPETSIIPLQTYQKIEDFLKSGGYLIALGQLPKTGLNPTETNSVVRISQQLSKSSRVQIVKNLTEIATSVKKQSLPDIKLNEPFNELFYNHRSDGKSDIYFLINLSDKPVEREVSFRAMGNIEKWNPLSGEIIRVKGKSIKNITTITTSLKPMEGVIYVFEGNN